MLLLFIQGGAKRFVLDAKYDGYGILSLTSGSLSDVLPLPRPHQGELIPRQTLPFSSMECGLQTIGERSPHVHLGTPSAQPVGAVPPEMDLCIGLADKIAQSALKPALSERCAEKPRQKRTTEVSVDQTVSRDGPIFTFLIVSKYLLIMG